MFAKLTFIPVVEFFNIHFQSLSDIFFSVNDKKFDLGCGLGFL